MHALMIKIIATVLNEYMPRNVRGSLALAQYSLAIIILKV